MKIELNEEEIFEIVANHFNKITSSVFDEIHACDISASIERLEGDAYDLKISIDVIDITEI